MTINHLILSGGGIKAISILGALNYLIEKKVLNIVTLSSICGASAGALIGMLLTIGYSPKELYQECKDTTISSLLDPDISLIVKYYGIDTGHKLLKHIAKLFKKKGYSENITFQQLYNKTNIHLIFTGTNVNLRVTEYFDYIHTPELRVIDGMRVSISVPGYFTSPKYEDCYYVDGGLLDNFPLHLFHHVSPHNVLAIKFKKIRDRQTLFINEFINNNKSYENENYDLGKISLKNHIDILDNVEKFFTSLLGCLMDEIEYLKSTTNHELYFKSTIFIEENELTSMDLNVTREQQERLYRNGILSAKKYIRSDSYLNLCIEKMPDNIKDIINYYIGVKLDLKN